MGRESEGGADVAGDLVDVAGCRWRVVVDSASPRCDHDRVGRVGQLVQVRRAQEFDFGLLEACSSTINGEREFAPAGT